MHVIGHCVTNPAYVPSNLHLPTSSNLKHSQIPTTLEHPSILYSGEFMLSCLSIWSSTSSASLTCEFLFRGCFGPDVLASQQPNIRSGFIDPTNIFADRRHSPKCQSLGTPSSMSACSSSSSRASTSTTKLWPMHGTSSTVSRSAFPVSTMIFNHC